MFQDSDSPVVRRWLSVEVEGTRDCWPVATDWLDSPSTLLRVR